MNNIEKTLKERGENYGKFIDNATIAQNIKAAMRSTPNWWKLTYDKQECLEMLAVKISRILNCNSEHYDSWHDMIGYITLVMENLEQK